MVNKKVITEVDLNFFVCILRVLHSSLRRCWRIQINNCVTPAPSLTVFADLLRQTQLVKVLAQVLLEVLQQQVGISHRQQPPHILIGAAAACGKLGL